MRRLDWTKFKLKKKGLGWWMRAGTFILLGLGLLFGGERISSGQVPSASDILTRVDDVINAPRDREARIKVIIIDKKGKEEVREMVNSQKGSDRRLVRFIAPAEHRGISFLSLPNEVMYLYLPAYGRTRRIASHVKNTKFAGTDFTYEDMEAVRYSEKWNPELLRQEEGAYVLELKPKEGTKTQYSRMVMWVRADIFYPTKAELYDRADRLYKILSLDKIDKVGPYWISREMIMEDLKERRKTMLRLEEVKFDSGLADEIFTERYLMR